MKRLALTFVALLAMFMTVETAKADWVLEVSYGWVGFRWDPAFDDGTFGGDPTYPPPANNYTLIKIRGIWYALVY